MMSSAHPATASPPPDLGSQSVALGEGDDSMMITIHHHPTAEAEAEAGASDDDDDDSIKITIRYHSTAESARALTFSLDKGELANYAAAWDSIMPWLDDLEIPFRCRSIVIDATMDCANWTVNMNQKSLVMEVFIEPAGGVDGDILDDYYLDDEDEYYYPPVDDQMDVDEVLEPASKEAVERLVKVTAKEDQGTCVVCLEDFVLGSCLVMLPCSHAYHADCIVKWLEKKSYCPLCRYKLPC
ncbi:hypothetical protein Dimus_017678 [Dionaea muscipula]